jgi:hypothetical protein
MLSDLFIFVLAGFIVVLAGWSGSRLGRNGQRLFSPTFQPDHGLSPNRSVRAYYWPTPGQTLLVYQTAKG